MAALDPVMVASCHGPTLSGASLAESYEVARTLPGRSPMIEPCNADLEAIMRDVGALA
jgi:hypothetical protein